MAYDYDPFEMPIKGMKIPEWVTSTQPPIDAFAQADAVQNRDMAIRNQELNALMEATKIQQFNRAREKQDRLDTSLEGFGQWYAKNQGAKTPEVYKQIASSLIAGGDPASAINAMQSADRYLKDIENEKYQKLRTIATLGNLNPAAAMAAAGELGLGDEFSDPGMFKNIYKNKRGRGEGDGGGGEKDKAFKMETLVSPDGKTFSDFDVGSVKEREEFRRKRQEGWRIPTDDELNTRSAGAKKDEKDGKPSLWSRGLSVIFGGSNEKPKTRQVVNPKTGQSATAILNEKTGKYEIPNPGAPRG